MMMMTLLIVPGVSATGLSVSPVIIPEGQAATLLFSLDNAPAGLAGYQVILSSDNPGVMNITGVSFPEWASLSEATPGEDGSYNLKAIDLNGKVEAGASNITLAVISVKGTGPGTAQIIIKNTNMDDDAGSPIQTDINQWKITVEGSSSTTPVAEPTEVPVTQPTPSAEPTEIPVTQPTPSAEPTEVPVTQPTPSAEPVGVPGTQPIPAVTAPVSDEVRITLNPGWNLINIPMQPSQGYETAEIFKNVQNAGHSVLTYDPTTGWISIGNRDILTPMTGYWIFSNQGIMIPVKVSGSPVSSRILNPGWNLAGISGRDQKPAETALQSLSGWTQVIGFDSGRQQYRDAIIRGSPNAQTLLTPGEGFWIFMQSQGQLNP